MSGAVSAQYGVTCPTCGAKPFETCQTLSTGRATDTHIARLVANERRNR